VEPRGTAVAVNSPTAAPLPASTSLPAATPIRHVDLPAWAADPAADILLVATTKTEGIRELTLVNASSLESWSLPGFHGFDAYFWSPDGRQIGILLSDEKLLLVDVLTGNLEFLPAGEHVTRLEGNYGDALVARPVPGDPKKFILHPWYWLKNNISTDGRYLVEQGMGTTDIIDVETGERTPITRAEDGLDDYMVEWSPVGPELAVAQADRPSSMFIWFEEIPNFTLKIYDADGRLLRKYRDVTFPHWSPDGTRFIYQPLNAESHMFWESAPCIFDTLTGETRCYNDISVRHHADIYTSLQWLPDRSRFGYIYSRYDLEQSVYHGGLCFVEISNGREECILQDNPDQLNVTRYLLSPDGRFVSAYITDGSPHSDDLAKWVLVVAGVETGKSLLIDGTSWLYTYDLGLWRPALSQ
jgi:hypothetical protein